MELNGALLNGFEDAIAAAIAGDIKPTTKHPRRYEVVRRWVELGGVVGKLYNVTVVAAWMSELQMSEGQTE